MSTANPDIFLDLGLVRSMQSEDQVAFVLAHELSHVILGHTSSDVVKKTQQQALALTELGLAVGAQVRAAQGKGTGGMAHDARLKQQKQVLALNSLVLSPAWTRGQEREADLLGTDMLVKAGYNPSAVDEVLAKLAEVEADPERVTADDMMQQIKALDLVNDKDMAKVTHAPHAGAGAGRRHPDERLRAASSRLRREQGSGGGERAPAGGRSAGGHAHLRRSRVPRHRAGAECRGAASGDAAARYPRGRGALRAGQRCLGLRPEGQHEGRREARHRQRQRLDERSCLSALLFLAVERKRERPPQGPAEPGAGVRQPGAGPARLSACQRAAGAPRQPQGGDRAARAGKTSSTTRRR